MPANRCDQSPTVRCDARLRRLQHERLAFRMRWKLHSVRADHSLPGRSASPLAAHHRLALLHSLCRITAPPSNRKHSDALRLVWTRGPVQAEAQRALMLGMRRVLGRWVQEVQPQGVPLTLGSVPTRLRSFGGALNCSTMAAFLERSPLIGQQSAPYATPPTSLARLSAKCSVPLSLSTWCCQPCTCLPISFRRSFGSFWD